MLATNPEHATSWFWFKKKLHKPDFTGDEVATSLIDFANENIEAKFSVGTVKLDSSVLLRTYVQSRASTKVPAEEALDSPLSQLKLITYSTATKTYHSKREQQENLPLGIFGYAICDLFTKLDKKAIPIEELMYNQNNMIAPGLIFRLTETALLTKLEQLIQYIPNVFEITDTAGIHQLYFVGKINPFDYLKKHYAL